jgi:hypothetical protein
MAFHRTMKLGIVGALFALAAVPSIAHATPTMFTNYASWNLAVTGTSVREYTTICTVQYSPPAACGSPAADLSNISSVPLRGGVSLDVVSPTLKKNVVGTDWTAFWPNGLTTGTPYTGDILASKAAVGGVLVQSIALSLSSPLTQFGFVALPQDSGNPYDMTVTLLDSHGNTLTTEDAIIGPYVGAFPGGTETCSQGSLGGDPTGAPTPCGFFGYTGGNSVAGIDISITNSACTDVKTVKSAVAPISCNGGLVVGDFVVGAVAPAPEPASLAILGAGLFGLGAIRRRLKS